MYKTEGDSVAIGAKQRRNISTWKYELKYILLIASFKGMPFFSFDSFIWFIDLFKDDLADVLRIKLNFFQIKNCCFSTVILCKEYPPVLFESSKLFLKDHNIYIDRLFSPWSKFKNHNLHFISFLCFHALSSREITHYKFWSLMGVPFFLSASKTSVIYKLSKFFVKKFALIL